MARSFRSRRMFRPYRTYKRYGKRFGRSRWKNKKFSKFNNKSRASIKGLIMPKSAYVKLPWRQISATSISPASSVNTMWVPTAYIPFPSDYTTDSTRVIAQAGDKFTNGIVQYAQFFDAGYVLGSSIKLQIMSTNTATNQGLNAPVLLATLVAYPYNQPSSTATPGGGIVSANVRAVYDYLNTLTDDNLQSLANAQSRMVTMAAAKAEIFFKNFRKTKTMCGVKDIEDNDDMEINIPQSDTDYAENYYGASQGFIYYLRISNLAADTNTTAFMVNAKLTQYWKLTSRRPVLQGVAEDE